ncbi:Type 1 glutamine amidotransferase-like domain-containing protein [Exiguobacterium acetylicum]|uniref:Type 1 glutamine amidotransferase-like domain-containing protein n=1 Tax=Exiguobacterium acetylicum TaxID=41170 RepID=UPI001EE193F5|nr:Type 1 glutamine amidotransferase-like domain-containing protein [Exiguobacterium acetylicum]UKS54661.1 Type 1 glutamine amidotransferase-like domain-containing protein [Exiguobacterium acetylicum]
MNLMLIGGGQLIAPSHQVINRHVFQLTSYLPHIVFLPTASRDERLYQQQFRSTYEALGATVSIITLFDDNQTIDTQRQLLQHADIIYVGGGHYPLLVKTLEDTGMDVLLKHAVERGTWYVGVSAGAIYPMEYGIRTREDGTDYCLDTGQGWLSGCLCPHLNQEKRAARFQGYLSQMESAIGLPDDTAYIQSETDQYMLGEGYELYK